MHFLKTARKQSYCTDHLWSNKHACGASAVLCIDWIRSKISLCDQGRDRVRLKDLRLHLPMNIRCLSEARAGDPLSGPWGVGGNLPFLHLATFQQFLMWMRRHIPDVLKRYAAAVSIKWKLSFSSWINVSLFFCFFVFFLYIYISFYFACKWKYNKWFILPSKSKLFHTASLPIPTDTGLLFGSDLVSECF